MNAKSWIIALAIVFIVLGFAFKPESAQARSAEVDRARLDDLRRKGFEAMYNLDYEGARRHFKEIIQLFPDHPAGPQCLAASLWLQELNQSRLLQASLYNVESLGAKNKDRTDPRTLEQFHQWTRQAKQLAQARLRRNPRDVEALYFLGATEGLKAVFASVVERKFFAALQDASRSVDRHREALKLDPNLRDAELTIGLYDYIIGQLPPTIKLLASIGGMRGSKKRGLKTLERVSKEGLWARDIARVLLIDLYKREKRWAEAAGQARELATKYPRNYIFRLQIADALISQVAALQQAKAATAYSSAEQLEAFSIFESLLRGQNGGVMQARDLIHFRYGEALFVSGQPERAIKEFLAAASTVGADSGLITLARLRAAQSMDLVGKRNEALVQYRVVLERPNISDAHKEAQRGLREPYNDSNKR